MDQAQRRRKARVTTEADGALAGAHPREMLPVQLPMVAWALALQLTRREVQQHLGPKWQRKEGMCYIHYIHYIAFI